MRPFSADQPDVSISTPLSRTDLSRSAAASMKVDAPGSAQVNEIWVTERNVCSPGPPVPSVTSRAMSYDATFNRRARSAASSWVRLRTPATGGLHPVRYRSLFASGVEVSVSRVGVHRLVTQLTRSSGGPQPCAEGRSVTTGHRCGTRSESDDNQCCPLGRPCLPMGLGHLALAARGRAGPGRVRAVQRDEPVRAQRGSGEPAG